MGYADQVKAHEEMQEKSKEHPILKEKIEVLETQLKASNSYLTQALDGYRSMAELFAALGKFEESRRTSELITELQQILELNNQVLADL